MFRAGARAGLAALLTCAAAAPAAAAPVVDGNARFEVITPSLIRMEYAADGRFEDRRSQTTAGRTRTAPRFRTSVRGSQRVITTSRLRLRWQRGMPFNGETVRVRGLGRDRALYAPAPGPNPAPLGGWRRSLDLVSGPVPLHEGMLSREGWYLLDDSATALMTGGGFEPRPARDGDYQDLYLFVYGEDYVQGLRDLRVLTGSAPLLPRKAFGVWFSRWWPYGEQDWRAIVERFRQERVPVDTLSLDTDFKRVHDAGGAAIASAAVGAPGGNYSWNGWDWNRSLFPDPARFFRWARDQGIEVGLNLHPSISSSDPQFAATQQRAGGGLQEDPGCRVTQADPNGLCMVFDWTDPKQLDAYFGLHESFERDFGAGAGFWWLDWCCDGSRADAPGLTPDTWINQKYFERQRARGSRWPSFQRMGGSFQAGFAERVGNGAFAEHRYTLQFTGDTCASWPLVGFAAQFTAAAASIGMPYVSHDIGTFHGVTPGGVCEKNTSPLTTPRASRVPEDMYVRWVQLGTFQPLLRLHSHHGLRLPWEYPGRPGEIAAEFLRLREALGPHLYALAREAVDTGVPMVRPLYLHWPREREAYEHPSQFLLGRDLLVAPVAQPGDGAQVDMWFPPGVWVDWFTGERHRGPARKTLSVPLERLPVFARAGGLIPMQREVATTPAAPPASLVLAAHAGNGRTTLYDDAGDGLDYLRGRFARTQVRQRRTRRASRLVIGPMRGSFAGRPSRRSWEIRLVGVPRPRSVTVAGRRARGWRYVPATRTVTVQTRSFPTRRSLTVLAR